ncbi:MAG: DUF559 domain-containing protein [Pseudomonadota bacterium]
MTPLKAKSSHVSLRIGLSLFCLVLGVAFPIAFCAAFLLVASLVREILPDRPERHDSVADVREWDANWRERFHRLCDSPAETAFLDAMIDTFDLVPKNGLLVGAGLELNLQVPVSRYRLDFLINARLIVEIDGHRWHSSPQAVARDAARDAYFRSEGYIVLRIPAKFALYEPQVAIAKVRQACARLNADNARLTHQRRRAFRPKAVAASLAKALDDLGKGVSAATSYVDERIEQQKREDALREQAETDAVLRQINDELAADEALAEMFHSLKKEFGSGTGSA